MTNRAKVWRDLDQEALDDAYDQRAYAANFTQVADRMASRSRAMRQRRGEPLTFEYGRLPIQRLYYYPAPGLLHPVMVHVRGGAWKQRSAQDVAFPAEAFNNAGVGFAVFDFSGVEEAGGDLRRLLDQVVEALVWVARRASGLGGDPDRLYLSGFSSGAHLAAVAMTVDWRTHGFARVPYRAASLISGMYDLKPVRLSKRSEYVRFTDDIEHSMSAERHLEKLDVPILLAYGTFETPEFRRQSIDFASALERAGKSVRLVTEDGLNHLETMEALGNPYSAVGRATIDLIQDAR